MRRSICLALLSCSELLLGCAEEDLRCTDLSIDLVVGQPKALPNPSGDDYWSSNDVFVLGEPHVGLSMDMQQHTLTASAEAPAESYLLYSFGRFDERCGGNVLVRVRAPSTPMVPTPAAPQAPSPLLATAHADRASIQRGDKVSLQAEGEGGTPPYAYAWSLAGTVENATQATTGAAPMESTTFEVTVTDAAGNRASAQVRVEVRLPQGGLTACFEVHAEDGVNANADCSQGNIVSYVWDLAWTAESPDLVQQHLALAMFRMTPDETPRTIRLTVTDDQGHAAQTERSF